MLLRLRANYLWPGMSYPCRFQNWRFLTLSPRRSALLTRSDVEQVYVPFPPSTESYIGVVLTCVNFRSAFCVDDQNQALADWYGIVMGTSHEEPLMRSLPPEWNIFGKGPWDYSKNQANVYDFWKAGGERAKKYEGLYTIGMRGRTSPFACLASVRFDSVPCILCAVLV